MVGANVPKQILQSVDTLSRKAVENFGSVFIGCVFGIAILILVNATTQWWRVASIVIMAVMSLITMLGLSEQKKSEHPIIKYILLGLFVMVSFFTGMALLLDSLWILLIALVLMEALFLVETVKLPYDWTSGWDRIKFTLLRKAVNFLKSLSILSAGAFIYHAVGLIHDLIINVNNPYHETIYYIAVGGSWVIVIGLIFLGYLYLNAHKYTNPELVGSKPPPVKKKAKKQKVKKHATRN